MTKKLQVYVLAGARESIWQRAAATLGDDTYFWVADVVKLELGHGLPEEWRMQGAVFSHKAELRFWREAEDYRALLLTDEPLPNLLPAPGNWESWEDEEDSILLQDLHDRRVSPGFASYPTGSSTGRLRVRYYCHDGTITFISPRGFEE